MYDKIKEIISVKNFVLNRKHLICWIREKSVATLSYYHEKGFDLVHSEKIKNGWNLLPKDEEHVYVIVTPPFPAIWHEYFVDSEGNVRCNEKVFENFAVYVHGEDFTIGTVLNEEMYITGIHRRDTEGNFEWTIEEESVLFFQVGSSLLYYNTDDDKHPQLTNVNINTGEIIWRKQTKNYSGAPERKENNMFQITGFLGYIKDTILVILFDGSITEIDVKTGHRINTWISGSEGERVLDPYKSLFLKDSMKIVGVSGKYFYEIDLTKKNLKVVDLEKEFLIKNIQTINLGITAFMDNHVIFPSEVLLEHPGFKYEYVNKIVALNIDTLKVDWSHHFKELYNANAFTDVQTDENHIYVCDSQQKLHVFKKQNDKN